MGAKTDIPTLKNLLPPFAYLPELNCWGFVFPTAFDAFPNTERTQRNATQVLFMSPAIQSKSEEHEALNSGLAR